jgi:hypothetical protein
LAHADDKDLNVLLFADASYDPGRASTDVVRQLRQRLSELEWQRSVQMLAVFPDDSQYSWSSLDIDCRPCVGWHSDERAPVGRYAGGAVPTMTYGGWPSTTPLPAPLVYADYALTGLLLTAEEHAGFADCPLQAVQHYPPGLAPAAGTCEPRPIDTASDLGDVQSDVPPGGQRDLPSLTRVLPGPQAPYAPVTMPPRARVISVLIAVSGALQDSIREDLLRFVDGIRAILCHTLLLVLSMLMRRPAGLSFTLILVAVSRRYGRRGEPGDHLFPALRPMSVIIGEAAVRAG